MNSWRSFLAAPSWPGEAVSVCQTDGTDQHREISGAPGGFAEASRSLLDADVWALSGSTGANRERRGAAVHPYTGGGLLQRRRRGKAAERPGAAGTQDRKLGRCLCDFQMPHFICNRSLEFKLNPTLTCFSCLLLVAFRMVDAVGLPGLPHARGGVHKPWGRPASHALPRSTRTDEVRDHNPFWQSGYNEKGVRS